MGGSELVYYPSTFARVIVNRFYKRTMHFNVISL